MNHFIALVEMGGQHQGKIGQHGCRNCHTKSDAILWSKNRFSRPFVIVECHPDDLSLDRETAIKEYKTGKRYEPNREE